VELERIAEALLTPSRGELATSTVPWESRETLDTPHGSIAYWTSGSGPAVLLVHGWEGSHAQMDAFVAPLLARDARVVSLDCGAVVAQLACGAGGTHCDAGAMGALRALVRARRGG